MGARRAKGNVAIILAISIASVFLVGGGIFASGIAAISKGTGDLPSGTSGGSSGGYSNSGACYLGDQYFTDPADEITAAYARDKLNIPSSVSDEKIQKLIDNIRAAGYNPALALATWKKESSFGTDENNVSDSYGRKEMGVTNNCKGGFDNQITCYIQRMEWVKNNDGPYGNRPEGKPLMVHWIDIYTPASDNRNNVKSDRSIICNVLKAVVPNQTEEASSINMGVIKGNSIIIDPGHGNKGGSLENRGFIGEQTEAGHNWEISVKVMNILKEKGYDVALTKSSAADNPELPARVRFANNNNAKAFISIHSNASESHRGNGVLGIVYCNHSGVKSNGEVDYQSDSTCPKSPQVISSMALSKNVVKSIMNSFSYLNDQYWGGDPGVLVGLKMPGIIIEMFYHDNQNDLNIYNNQQDKMAQAIAEGIINTMSK